MELTRFLNGPQHNTKPLNIVSWNIGGCRTKLEKKNVEEFLLNYDIIVLNEVKTPFYICLPGYVSYMSYNKECAHRGGTTVLVRNALSGEVKNIDTSIYDQIWFQLRNMPGVTFGACYIPPSDSQYFSNEAFAAIQERFVDNSDQFVIIGDMNTRFGRGVREVVSNCNHFSYPYIPDDVITPNDNAYVFTTICKENDLVVVNNLKFGEKQFVGDKTYKQGNRWVSELDVCVVSCNFIDNIRSFQVHQGSNLPSDHAPISLQINVNSFSPQYLLSRASLLGGHNSFLGRKEHKWLDRKPIRFNEINAETFSDHISDMDIDVTDNSIDNLANNVSEVLYKCAEMSRIRTRREVPLAVETEGTSRWDGILQDHDDARVWSAIDWKGKLQGNKKSDNCPSDKDFKEFFEGSISADTVNTMNDNILPPVNIPLLDDMISTEEVQRQIKSIKPDKASGPDGVSPGIFRLLLAQLILNITTLCNCVLFSLLS